MKTSVETLQFDRKTQKNALRFKPSLPIAPRTRCKNGAFSSQFHLDPPKPTAKGSRKSGWFWWASVGFGGQVPEKGQKSPSFDPRTSRPAVPRATKTDRPPIFLTGRFWSAFVCLWSPLVWVWSPSGPSFGVHF